MDEAQFQAEASMTNGRFFAALIAAWKKKGGSLKWGAGGAGLRGFVDGKDVGIGFLAPAFAGKKDRIELSFTGLAKPIGATRCQAFEAALRKAAGDHVRGATMVRLVEPGELSPAGQKALTAALRDLL